MKRKVNIANFNLTFGDNEEPMLAHFDDIVYPAFTSGIKKRSFNGIETNLFLHDVKLEKDDKDNYLLSGLIVKQTKLEIKSQIEGEELIDTNYEYPTAPYSYFCIYLKNHRMYLVKNQNGSPEIRSFQSLLSYILKEYVSKENGKIESEDEKLPLPYLEVVGVPFKSTINKELEKVEKISQLTLKFFPLNGDTDFNDSFQNLSKLRREIGSKSGRVTYNSPDDKESVINLLEQTNGTVDPILKVKYKNGEKESTITVDKLSEKFNVDIDNEGLKHKNINNIKNIMNTSETLTNTEGSHLKIFEKYKDKILKCLIK